MTSTDDGAETLKLTRFIDAPRELVFEAWSSAEHLKRWFCPEGLDVSHAEVDFRPGGVAAICMRAPNGHEFWSRGEYVEIVAPERIVSFSHAGDPERPGFTARTTVTFAAEGAGTRLGVHQIYDIHDPAMRAALAGASEGWQTTLDKLERAVARIKAGG